MAKALAEKRVQKARDARKADELKRSIRNNAAQLNQMVLRPKPGKYVQKSLIVQAAEVAKLADTAVLNNNALTKLTALQDSIRRSGEMDVSIHADWENSGVENLIQTLRDDMNASKQAKLDRLRQQLEEAKALPDGDKAEQLRDRLRQRIRETENRTYLPMTVDQLRMLKSITASTLHIIRTENKTLSLARAEEVDGMAMKAAREVLNSEGNGFGEKFEKAKGAMNRYQLDMLGGTRMFRRLGGYTKKRPDGEAGADAERRPAAADGDPGRRRKPVCQRDRQGTPERGGSFCRAGGGAGGHRIEGQQGQCRAAEPRTAVQPVHKSAVVLLRGTW